MATFKNKHTLHLKVNLIIVILVMIMSVNVEAKPQVKVKYRKHTSFDFAGEQVSGKVKGANVFYIFQRKRSSGHFVVKEPYNLNWHNQHNINIVKNVMKKN